MDKRNLSIQTRELLRQIGTSGSQAIIPKPRNEQTDHAVTCEFLTFEDEGPDYELFSLTPAGKTFANSPAEKTPLKFIRARLAALYQRCENTAFNEGIRFGPPQNGWYRASDVGDLFTTYNIIVNHLYEYYQENFSDINIRDRQRSFDGSEFVEVTHLKDVLRLAQDLQHSVTLIDGLLESEKEQPIPMTINIEKFQGVLNTGVIKDVGTISVSISELTASGQEDVAKHIQNLTECIGVATEFTDEQRSEALARIAQLSAESIKPKEQRLPKMNLRDSYKALSEIVKVSAACYEIWHAAGPALLGLLCLGS